MNKKFFLIAILSALFCGNMKAQIMVDQSLTLEQYVNDFLLGGGVSATNITFTGSLTQIGAMTGGEGTVFPIDSGLVLATTSLDPPFNETAIPDPFNGGEPDLLTVAQSVPELIGQTFEVTSVNDVAILEFDFIPSGDTISFDYVFGSDEYLTYVNTSFNDIFAFFLSGPGIAGPFASPAGFPNGAINIAQVPDSDPPLPITISSVNPQTNPEYYIDNPANTDISLNGFTVELTASYPVTCGETYHIKFAIADGTDDFLESVVALESGSFISNGTVDLNFEYTPSSLTSLNESSPNCNSGEITINRPPCQSDTLYYQLDYSEGTAIYGVDYDSLVIDTLFLPGEDQIVIPITVFPDNEVEGEEYIYLSSQFSGVSANGPWEVGGSDTITLIDGYTFPLDIGDAYIRCPQDSAVLTAEGLPEGEAPFQYYWTNEIGGDTIGDYIVQTVPVPPNYDEEVFYYVTAIDDCGMTSIQDSAWIINRINEAPTTFIETDGVYCVGVDYPIHANVVNGTSDFNYDFSGGGGSYSGSSPEWVIPYVQEETEFYVTVTDHCDRLAYDTISISPPPPVEAGADVIEYICIDEVLQLNAEASGGLAPYNYIWSMDPNIGVILDVNPSTGKASISDFQPPSQDDYLINVIVTVKDECQSRREFFDQFLYDETIVIENEVNLLDCIVPNVVSANGDNMNDFFVADELLARPGRMSIYNRWGELMKETSQHFWDPAESPDGTYFYIIQFENEELRKGSFTILR